MLGLGHVSLPPAGVLPSVALHPRSSAVEVGNILSPQALPTPSPLQSMVRPPNIVLTEP